MDAMKTGALIKKRRTEKGMTQKQLAEALHVSDKAVSKWERGLGCPDISLLGLLSAQLDVDMTTLHSGTERLRTENGGNMKRIAFYICPVCGNVITATADTEVSCCSRRIEALKPQKMDDAHRPTVVMIDDERYVTFAHPMEKGHYIRFAACVTYDRVLLVRMYPEQGAELRLPYMPRCRCIIACSKEGLFEFML